MLHISSAASRPALSALSVPVVGGAARFVQGARRLGLGVVVAAALVGGAGCKPELLPGTTVEDTPENRQVLTFLTRYQAAMQERSPDKVAALCAADYYEDNGNQDPKDDYNLDGLKAKLTAHFARTKELTLEVYVQQVERLEDGRVAVAYRYRSRALVSFPSGEKWLTANEVNKVLVRPVEGDEAGFRIVSGL